MSNDVFNVVKKKIGRFYTSGEIMFYLYVGAFFFWAAAKTGL